MVSSLKCLISAVPYRVFTVYVPRTGATAGDGRMDQVRINEGGKDLALVFNNRFDIQSAALGEINELTIWNLQKARLHVFAFMYMHACERFRVFAASAILFPNTVPFKS